MGNKAQASARKFAALASLALSPSRLSPAALVANTRRDRVG
eukprot:CAMPEP_0119508028 /NCGR_PEP_ID=MMETSP1344-20130328/27765_1 /TAXON_ID=236787 /ORGANISM="Florenciella parvula, Strain CCMP2471" /LENGTH=40 /DNA_ID= /DNA_START= /DNA_END= /DNA_ORIENTATION=